MFCAIFAGTSNKIQMKQLISLKLSQSFRSDIGLAIEPLCRFIIDSRAIGIKQFLPYQLQSQKIFIYLLYKPFQRPQLGNARALLALNIYLQLLTECFETKSHPVLLGLCMLTFATHRPKKVVIQVRLFEIQLITNLLR